MLDPLKLLLVLFGAIFFSALIILPTTSSNLVGLNNLSPSDRHPNFLNFIDYELLDWLGSVKAHEISWSISTDLLVCSGIWEILCVSEGKLSLTYYCSVNIYSSISLLLIVPKLSRKYFSGFWKCHKSLWVLHISFLVFFYVES